MNTAVTVKDFAARHLADLRAAATEIVKAIISAVNAQLAQRPHDGEQTHLFVGRFAMTHMTDYDCASVGQAPHVARPVCGLSSDVA
jgi:hypothetical protein